MDADLEAMHIAKQIDPEIAEGLRRLREAERQHCEELLDMLVKSDPYTLGRAADEARHGERHGPAPTWSKGPPAESGARVVG